MTQIIEAPKQNVVKYISVFLAGGISKCDDWQSKVIEKLKNRGALTIFNPRRKKFDVDNKSAELEQICWEFDRLERMDIFSMYFCDSESVQPICMYELGRYICRMQERFPDDWDDRIVISVEKGYSRASDVLIQTRLAGVTNVYLDDVQPESHADRILQALDKIIASSDCDSYMMFG